MSDTPTFLTLARILEHDFGCTAGALQHGTALADLGLDSLTLMEFVFAAEDALRIRIPEERLDPRQAGLTLGDLCIAIDTLLVGEIPRPTGTPAAPATPATPAPSATALAPLSA